MKHYPLWKCYICQSDTIIPRLLKRISDSKIIEGVKKQDEKTLNWLYDNYFQTVKNYVLKNSGTTADVSDVFQDSIIILFNQINAENLNLTTDLKGYFYGIAKNVWSAQLRRKRKTTELLDIDMPDEMSHDESDESMFEKIISRAFKKLKPDSQVILTLFADGYTYEEIAVKMNLKNGVYARRKKYLSKEALIELVKEDPEYQEYLRYRK
jgi:RNA polymerase sigma factor (sigma-70 family)